MIIPSRQKRHLEQSNSLSMDKDIKEANGNEMFILINALLRTIWRETCDCRRSRANQTVNKIIEVIIKINYTWHKKFPL